MTLYQHDGNFTIKINGLELMNSRQHESERELAQLGCIHLIGQEAPCVLIGGLGMGYTLRHALNMLTPNAHLVVSELMPAVVEWNKTHLSQLNEQVLDDKRIELITGDIVDLIAQSAARFDAILLDVDNGPSAMTDAGNQRLYSAAGIQACRRALRKSGTLAVWSTEQSKSFEKVLLGCGFKVRRYKVKAYKETNTQALYIWVATEDESKLPAGGDAPDLTVKPAIPMEVQKKKKKRLR